MDKIKAVFCDQCNLFAQITHEEILCLPCDRNSVVSAIKETSQKEIISAIAEISLGEKGISIKERDICKLDHKCSRESQDLNIISILESEVARSNITMYALQEGKTIVIEAEYTSPFAWFCMQNRVQKT
ncbi:MAG: hypothetical protein FJZ56_01760 [Chlamydiae bacterium]|nr:hypothetical protein [Chlamydiota bacterium]